MKLKLIHNDNKNGLGMKKLVFYMIPIIVIIIAFILFLTVFSTSDSTAEETRGSSDDPCYNCHQASDVMPGVLADWEKSKHYENNVTCITCHQAQENDPDAIPHKGFQIAMVVSPKDCSMCHQDAVDENEQSLHSLGSVYYELLYDKGKLPYMESLVDGEYITKDGEDVTHSATIRGCQSCHGTNMAESEDPYDWEVWPNNGIGRINPDGSKGSCAACHTRHTFSVAEARHPETCGQCHMGPDHPQIEMFMESKHGNIYASEGDSWNWSAEDWKAGVDYRAPTCASCHMSSAPGVPATHDVSSRLSWELESEISRRTDNIANSIGIEFGDGSTWQEKRGRMETVCKQCHGPTWVENYFEQADVAVDLYNQTYLTAKKIVDELYADGLLTNVSFDEPIEFKIYEMWHHEGRRARMGAFMQAPDYVQWHGFYELLQDRVEIEHMAEDIRSGRNITIIEETIEEPQEIDYESGLWCTTIVAILILVMALLFVVYTSRKRMRELEGKDIHEIEPGPFPHKKRK